MGQSSVKSFRYQVLYFLSDNSSLIIIEMAPYGIFTKYLKIIEIIDIKTVLLITVVSF